MSPRPRPDACCVRVTGFHSSRSWLPTASSPRPGVGHAVHLAGGGQHRRRQRPQPDRAVGAAADQLVAAVEGQRGHHVGVAQRAGQPPGAQVPQPDRAVAAARGQLGAVRAERHRVDPVGGAGQRGQPPGAGRTRRGRPAWSAPQPHLVVLAAGRQRAPVRAERHRRHRPGRARAAALPAPRAAAGWPRPRARPAAGRARGQPLPVRAERHRLDESPWPGQRRQRPG